jgi:hypothetical protein
MPLKGLTPAETAWLRRKARALGSLEAALRALVLSGRASERAARDITPLLVPRARPSGPQS